MWRTLVADLKTLIWCFVGPRRSLAQCMCVSAFARLQDDRSGEYEYSTHALRREMHTHTSILDDCKRFGAHFGSMPTPRALRNRMRIVEELYLCVELEDERTRKEYAPKLPVFAYTRVSRGRWGRQVLRQFPFGKLYLQAYIKAMQQHSGRYGPLQSCEITPEA